MVWAKKSNTDERRHERATDIPIVGLDYAFPSFGSGVMLTVLLVTEIFSGAVESIMVAEKGPTEYPVRTIIRVLRLWGIGRVMLWSDQEPAIKALASAVQAVAHVPCPVGAAKRL